MLKNSVAIVTGAASGIGRATASALAGHGARVVAVDISECSEMEVCERSYKMDVMENGAPEHLMNDIQKNMGVTPNVLVNAAGITRDGFLWKMSEDDFDSVIGVNLKAPFMLTRAFARSFMEAKANSNSEHNLMGSIINISSIIAKTGNMGQANYASSKAGLVGLTKSCAKDLARSGIRCNAILPGFIETPMSQAVPEKVLDSFKSQIPMGELGAPADIAEAAVFLASDKSKYITGASIEVTGGLYM